MPPHQQDSWEDDEEEEKKDEEKSKPAAVAKVKPKSKLQEKIAEKEVCVVKCTNLPIQK